MKYLFERRDFKKEKFETPKDLDETIKMICNPFTDNGFSLVVSHHYGSSFYTIYKDMYRTISYFDTIRSRDDLKDNRNISKFADQMSLVFR